MSVFGHNSVGLGSVEMKLKNCSITCNSDCIVAVEVVTVTLRILRIQTCYRLFSYVGAEFENGVNLRKVCERFCILQIIKKNIQPGPTITPQGF